MPRSLVMLATVAFAASLAGAAGAAPCKDAKGKFVKCPAPAAASTTRCRDKTSKAFVKCGTKNSEPVPVAAKK